MPDRPVMAHSGPWQPSPTPLPNLGGNVSASSGPLPDKPRRALQAVVDRFAQALVRDRGDGDGGRVGAVGVAQVGEEPGGGLAQVAGRAEVPAVLAGPEGQVRLTRLGLCRRFLRR